MQCQRCGVTLPGLSTGGLCPNCVLRTVLDAEADALGPAADTFAALPRLRYFGDYELLEEIARGGMGVVYRARQLSLNRIVAVKMMRPGVLSSPEEVERFRNEARLAAGLRHPNIVTIHEIGEHDGLHYFSMDYVDGISLAALAGRAPMSATEAARCVQTIAGAIHSAHQCGVLHRDLKPSNVLMDAAGEPHITDFGLAKQIAAEPGLTLSGAVIGTPGYMSPEQAVGHSDRLSAASDVYSLGALLYELLTGNVPFRASTPIETVKLVVGAAPLSLRAVNGNIPRDLDTICMKCLEKEPHRRYASAAALAEDLGRFLGGKPILARPTGLFGRGWRWCRRNPWPTTAAVLGALLALVAIRWMMLPRVSPASAGKLRFRVEVIAGPGDFGDGGPATLAWLPKPLSTALDAAGNVYISEGVCQCIRKVGADGIITRVAGMGAPGESADGTLAKDASIEVVRDGLTVDPSGGVFFSETSHCRVRKIDPAGRLVTVAGNGRCGFSGDGGPAAAAELSDPRALAIGLDGSLFIRERGGARIRRVAQDGTIVTFAGNESRGDAGDDGPAVKATLMGDLPITTGGKGNLFIRTPCRIRAVATDGIIRTVAGTGRCGFSGDGGPATRAQFTDGRDALTADAVGNFYLADGPVIRRVGTNGIITTIAGTGDSDMALEGMLASQAPLSDVVSLSAGRSGELYLAESEYPRVIKIGRDGLVHGVAGSLEIPDDVAPGRARLSPASAVRGKDGAIYISDVANKRIWRMGPEGKIKTVAATAHWSGLPMALAFDAGGDLLIGDISCACVWKLSLNGSTGGSLFRFAGGGRGYEGDGGPALQARLNLPWGMAVDPAGNIYIVDPHDRVIRRIGRDGWITTVIGGKGAPRARGKVKGSFPVDPSIRACSQRVAEYEVDAKQVGDGGLASDAMLNNPVDIAFDPQGNMLIADANNCRVRRVTKDGIISTIAGNGRGGYPEEGGLATQTSTGPLSSVAADTAGNVYFGDPFFGVVWMVTPDGMLRKAAEIPHPNHLSATPDGGFLVTDTGANKVYKLTPLQ